MIKSVGLSLGFVSVGYTMLETFVYSHNVIPYHIKYTEPSEVLPSWHVRYTILYPILSVARTNGHMQFVLLDRPL